MNQPGISEPLSPQTLAAERFHGMDALRGFAMLLGVFLHAALAYMTLDLSWPGYDAQRSMVFDIFVAVVHGFRMQLFFFIAGFFAHLLWQRIGEGAFLKHRLKRIGLPFIGGMVVIVPICHLLWGGALQWHAPAHLWFLEYLLFYYAATLLMLRASRTWPGRWKSQAPERWFRTLLRSPWKPFVLIVPTALILAGSPYWVTVEKSGASLLPTLTGFLYYGLFYLVGWWVHRERDLLATWSRHWGRYLLLAFPVFLLGGGLTLFAGSDELPFYKWIKLARDSVWALYTWLMVFGLTGLFVRALNFSHPAVRYVADASYWIYLAHLPLVVALQFLLNPYPWHSLVKFLLVSGVTLAALFASYHWLVRRSFIGAVLNGPRQSGRLRSAAP
jgi:glucans biosynthesis protein C